MRQLFEKAPLREGVDREQAYELIMLTMEHFEKKFLSETSEKAGFDSAYNKRLLEERDHFLDMVRYGIER